MAKSWLGEMVNRVAYQAVQLHGGYGYMEEYRICRLFRDARSPVHLRRHHRDHEADHRPAAGVGAGLIKIRAKLYKEFQQRNVCGDQNLWYSG